MFENQTADRDGIAFQRVRVEVEEREHVLDFDIAVDKELVLADFVVAVLNFLVLVPDVADDLLEQVFHRDDAQRAAVFVGDDRHVVARPLEGAENFRELLTLEHKERRLHDVPQGGRLAVRERLEIIARVQDADDIVNRVFVDRDARIAVLDNDVLDFLLRIFYVEEYHVDARREDFFCGRLVKVERRAHHFALAFLEHAFLLDALDDVFQLVLGDGGSLLALARDSEREGAQLHEHEYKRREQDGDRLEQSRSRACERVAVLPGKTFGNDLAEGQYQQRRRARCDSRADVAE